MRGLLIEWTPHTGERAGNINPKDPKLQCYGWQNMDVTPALELRIVEDDRDLSEYGEVEGITILDGKDEINDAIDANFSSKVTIEDELLYSEHLKEQIGDKKIKISGLPDDRDERLRVLKEKHHIKGIKETTLQKV